MADSIYDYRYVIGIIRDYMAPTNVNDFIPKSLVRTLLQAYDALIAQSNPNPNQSAPLADATYAASRVDQLRVSRDWWRDRALTAAEHAADLEETNDRLKAFLSELRDEVNDPDFCTGQADQSYIDRRRRELNEILDMP